MSEVDRAIGPINPSPGGSEVFPLELEGLDLPWPACKIKQTL